jgi:hypothetical protein
MVGLSAARFPAGNLSAQPASQAVPAAPANLKTSRLVQSPIITGLADQYDRSGRENQQLEDRRLVSENALTSSVSYQGSAFTRCCRR